MLQFFLEGKHSTENITFPLSLTDCSDWSKLRCSWCCQYWPKATFSKLVVPKWSVFWPPDACELTLDPNTAHKNLLLSGDKKRVTWVERKQPYPDHQGRFDHCQQVLCEQGLNGRCYWELEVLEPFSIGLTYRTISRKGDANDCKLGRTDKSWCLICSDDGSYVNHCNNSISVSSLCSRSSRVGVYLDWPAGTLSFYRVSSDSRTHLHTYKTKFTEPLYPAIELHTVSSASFCQLTWPNFHCIDTSNWECRSACGRLRHVLYSQGTSEVFLPILLENTQDLLLLSASTRSKLPGLSLQWDTDEQHTSLQLGEYSDEFEAVCMYISFLR